MSFLVKKSIIFVFILISLLSLVTLIGGTAFTVFFPETVIQLVEKLIPEKTPAPFTVKGIGVIGDSVSDEYRGDDSRGLTYAPTTLNWFEQLVKYRRVNAGKWGHWGEPRRTGFSYNWARTGATANSMLESGQHTGLAEQVKRGEVNLVIIYIGANDFAPYITSDGYDAIYNGTISEAALLQKQNRLVADITTAVDTIRQARKCRILLVKIPDWGNLFGLRVAFPISEQRKRVSESIAAVNSELDELAEKRGIATLDPNQFYEEVFRSGGAEITVGTKKLNAILPSDDPTSVFLEDGVHSGTILNGLFANFMMREMNGKLGTSYRLFSEDELFSIAGL
jgi:lysophospholipase L1-like esterase